MSDQSEPKFPNETLEYRAAREKLLQQEFELRRLTESVAASRRALPLGGKVHEDCVFEGASGPIKLSDMFGEHDTLFIYHWMFGPERNRPCPMCSSMLDALDGNVKAINEKVALAIVAGSPHQRLAEFAKERGWNAPPLFSYAGNSFGRDYHAQTEHGEMPMLNVFSKMNNGIYHRYGCEMFGVPPEDGQNPRGIDPIWPLWNLLDYTPHGRGANWGSHDHDTSLLRYDGG